MASIHTLTPAPALAAPPSQRPVPKPVPVTSGPIASGTTASTAPIAGRPGAPDPTAPGPAVGRDAAPGTGSPLPIDISPGFEPILAPASDPASDPDNLAGIPVRRHRKLEIESCDENWAGRVETDIRAQVRSELMAQGSDPQRIELSVVECRTSGCEVQAIGYPEDNLKGRDLQLILPKVMHGVMAADFDAKGLTMMVTSVPDGRVGYIAFLARKTP